MAPLLDSAVCEWGTSQFLIISSNVFENYIYYSHIFPAVTAIVLGVFVWLRSPRSLLHITLFAVTIFFGIWSFLDLILWATEKTPYTMFFWSILIYFDLLIYAGLLYFFYLFVDQKDISLTKKILIAVPFIPVFFLAHTQYNLIGFDFSNCDREALEGPLWQYVYLVEIGYVIWIAYVGMERIRKARDKAIRSQTLLFTTGVLLFLLAFSWGNIIGNLTVNWDLSQYGLFGMPVFLAFISYLIVKYRSFGIKILNAQILITASTLLVLAMLLIRTVEDMKVIAVITAVLIASMGFMLVRSVKKEVEQREHIEMLAGELKKTNERQDTLLHFIGHEVKGSLTKDMGAFAALSEGDFGQLPDGMKPLVEHALIESRQSAASVENILKASNLKKGTVTFTKAPFDLKTLAAETIDKARPMATEKGLTISFSAESSGAPYTINGDKEKIGDNILRNLIENAIHYTPSGAITVSLKKENGRFVLAVKDTGMGISEEDKKLLFTEGGHGKDSQTVNAHSTGYGLYIAKHIAEAHGGTIRAESEGRGSGSTFTVELPAS